MPNLRISNTIPNLRDHNVVPNLRSSKGSRTFQTSTTSSTTLKKGSPWGILLAITRNADKSVAEITTTTTFIGDGPNMRITNI